MQSCCVGLFWLLASLYEVGRIVQIEDFSWTAAPGGPGKNSICAVLRHFVNRNLRVSGRV